MPKLGEYKKSALSVLRSEVAYELEHRRQLHARPVLTHGLSVTETPGIPAVQFCTVAMKHWGWGQERDGYLSDPGSVALRIRHLLHKLLSNNH